MPEVTIGGIVKTSIVTAFTIAAALIWKDVIESAIAIAMPPAQQLLYKFLVAIVATVLVVIAIYIILKTEARVGKLEKLIKKRRLKK